MLLSIHGLSVPSFIFLTSEEAPSLQLLPWGTILPASVTHYSPSRDLCSLSHVSLHYWFDVCLLTIPFVCLQKCAVVYTVLSTVTTLEFWEADIHKAFVLHYTVSMLMAETLFKFSHLPFVVAIALARGFPIAWRTYRQEYALQPIKTKEDVGY